MNRARVRARVTQPRTRIFLHICTRSNFNSACHWHEGNSSTEHVARLKPCLGRRQTVDCLHQNSYLKWPFPKTPSLPDPVNKQNDATHTRTPHLHIPLGTPILTFENSREWDHSQNCARVSIITSSTLLDWLWGPGICGK